MSWLKFKRIFTASFVALLLLTSTPLGVLAQGYGDADDETKRQLGIYFVDGGSEGYCGTSPTSTDTTAPPSEQQDKIAQIIIGIAKTDNLPKGGALIGLMVGLDESSLRILANKNVPISELNPAKQGDGMDHDSVGVFQQRPSTSWSTYAPDGGVAADFNKDAVWQLMDPAYSAEAFFGSPPGSDAPSPLSKGLLNHPDWQTKTPWEAAQEVQASGTSSGLNYKKFVDPAQALIDRLWDSSPPVPLPVPFNAPPPGTGSSPDTFGSCATGNESTNGYVNPFLASGWGLARTDQGVDYIPNIPQPVVAIGNGTIVGTAGPGWPGGVFLYYKLSDGAFAGKCIFVAEHLINVLPSGSKITAGQTIATALPGYPWTEWGWAQGAQTPSVPYNGLADGTPTEGGKAFARFLRSLGAKTLQDPGAGPLYAGGTCP